MKFKLYHLFLIIVPIILGSCSKDSNQAEKSIIGDWNIIEITSLFGQFSNESFVSSNSITEQGNIGTFNFTKDSVAFDFTRNDTLYAGFEAWNISAQNVNSGFIRVTEFTLEIENQFTFGVQFDDGTKNSEENATNTTFTELPIMDDSVLIRIILDKN